MIKITAEIQENKFFYSYTVGDDETHNMEARIDSTKLLAFMKLLDVLQTAAWSHQDQFKDELTARCWIEKNPKKAKLL